MHRTSVHVLAGLLACLLAAPPSRGADDKNLVENAGFEEGEAGWKLHDHAEGRGAFVVTPPGRAGKCAAKLTLSRRPAGANVCLEQYRTVKGFGGKRWQFSCWLQSEGAQIRYPVACVFELPSKQRHWVNPVPWHQGWGQYDVAFDSQPDTTAIAVDFYLRHSGALLVDDARLAEHDGDLGQTSRPAVAPAPAPAAAAESKPAPIAPPQRDAQWQEATAFFREHPNPVDFRRDGNRLFMANRRIGLEFLQSERGFRVVRLYSLEHDQDFLVADPEMKLPNLIRVVMDTDPAMKRLGEKGVVVVDTSYAAHVEARCTAAADQCTLHLAWKGVAVGREESKLAIEATVALKSGDPFSYWRFGIKNTSVRYGPRLVYFPVLNLAPIGEKRRNVFIYPQDRGRLLEDVFNAPPGGGDGFHKSGRYPAAYGLQFQALYNQDTGVGVYLGTRDPTPNLKGTESYNHPSHIAWRIGHWPPNTTFADQDYALDFDCVVGPFAGDWWDACQIYRAWALKQSWCRRGPLAARRDIPKWYKEAPLFLVTSYWADNDHVAECVEHMRQHLEWAGVRLPCNVYAWKKCVTQLTAYDVPHSYWRTGYRRPGPCGNAHDGNYPKLPALPDFGDACRRLKEAGGMMCPYVCLQIYDQGPVENAPYVAEARPHVVRNPQGELQTYGREPSWAMCASTQWWRDRLTETCVELFRNEHAGGFYLDTMHGTTEYCYWTPHGHTAAGGSAGPAAMHGLAEQIRERVKALDPDLITSGEDSAENVIDVIDGKLYQHTLSPTSVAPLFAAVYQDYIPRYGMRLTPEDGEGFYMGAGSLFVEGAQLGRLRVAPHGPGLRFDDDPVHTEQRDFIGRVVSYYRQDAAKKFLCYGQLMRPLAFARPVPMPTVTAEVPRWTRANRAPKLPALLSGVFRAQDGHLGVFVVNIAKAAVSYAAEVGLAGYGLPGDAPVDVETITPGGQTAPFQERVTEQVLLKGDLTGRGMIMYRIKPAAGAP